MFVGGGLWHPEADHVQKLRASIDERPRRWRRALMEPAFVRTFLPKAKVGHERSIIKAFAVANEENALKTKPKVWFPSKLLCPGFADCDESRVLNFLPL